jgi:hypothetical protein
MYFTGINVIINIFGALDFFSMKILATRCKRWQLFGENVGKFFDENIGIFSMKMLAIFVETRCTNYCSV